MEFEKLADFNNYLQMRSFDEAAKVIGALVPDLDFYAPMIARNLLLSTNELSKERSTYLLSEMQLQFYESQGYLKVPNLLQFDGLNSASIQQWVAEIATWIPTPGKWLSHYELAASASAALLLPSPSANADGDIKEGFSPPPTPKSQKVKILCRNENFVDYHSQMSELARGSNSSLPSVVAQLFGEPASLFKEKINYKLPGEFILFS